MYIGGGSSVSISTGAGFVAVYVFGAAAEFDDAQIELSVAEADDVRHEPTDDETVRPCKLMTTCQYSRCNGCEGDTDLDADVLLTSRE